jgi:hypothetical protein
LERGKESFPFPLRFNFYPDFFNGFDFVISAPIRLSRDEFYPDFFFSQDFISSILCYIRRRRVRTQFIVSISEKMFSPKNDPARAILLYSDGFELSGVPLIKSIYLGNSHFKKMKKSTFFLKHHFQVMFM